MVDQKEARVMALPYGRVVYVPDVAQVGDVLCMFSKHDSTLIIRKEDDGGWKLVGNAFVLTTEKKRRQRLIPQLRSFKYCIPDYDLWPPPTSDPNERFLIRMSVITLQWMTRVQKWSVAQTAYDRFAHFLFRHASSRFHHRE
jgi:hypothetical protein